MRLLVHTGADRTILGPRDAPRMGKELGIDLDTLPQGWAMLDAGGRLQTRAIDAMLSFVGSPTAIPIPALPIMVPTLPLRPIPSLSGRDLLARFALFMEERTGRVLLLESTEANQIPQPLLPLP